MDIGLTLGGLATQLFSSTSTNPIVNVLNNDREQLKKILDGFKKDEYGALSRDSANNVISTMNIFINKYTSPVVAPAAVDKTALSEILYLINRSLPDMYKALGETPYLGGLRTTINYLERKKTQIQGLL